MPSDSPLRHVSDTARWVAMYRAIESERPDALFHDPYARQLAGPRGEAILDSMPKGRRMAWPMIVRTAVMDELIQRVAGADGVDGVLNLAAGLDTRAFRLPLSPSLRWFDVDLPEILGFRDQQLAEERPSCDRRSLAVDLTDAGARHDLFRSVAGVTSGVLVVTEGLLVYLEPEQVAALARDLHDLLPSRWWLLDLATPRLLKMLERTWGQRLREGNTPFRFAPAESTAFFRPSGWDESEFRSIWDESLRLGRSMPLARMWQVLSHVYPRGTRESFRRMSGVVLLRRGEAPRASE